ncbi:MAG: hypothetical protein LBI14_08070 [Treponema sp.]|jgi:hypothetical protein|nr:hypothetical protein [Treponema sp.]
MKKDSAAAVLAGRFVYSAVGFFDAAFFAALFADGFDAAAFFVPDFIAV